MLSELRNGEIQGVLGVLLVAQRIVYQDEEIKIAIVKLQEDERKEVREEARKAT